MNALAQEWRIVAREPAVRWAFIVLVLLAALSVWNGGQFKERRDAAAQAEIERSLELRQTAVEALRAEEAGEAPVNRFGPGNITRTSWNAARPSGPLAMLSAGREDLEPLSATVSIAGARDDNLFRKHEFANPLALAAGRFDAGFLVVLLMPLFILALTYNVVAVERETGRARVAAIQGGEGRRLMLRLALRLTPVLGGLAAIGVAALIAGAPAGRLGLWLAAAFVYLLLWSAVAALIATVRWRQEVLALTAAAVWLSIAVIIPAAGVLVARTAAPVPSAFEIINDGRQASIEANRDVTDNLRAYAAEHPDLMGEPDETDWSLRVFVSQLAIEERMAPVLAEHAEAIDRRSAWIDSLLLLSPTAVADRALTDIAGTSAGRQANYVAQVLAFRDQWRSTLRPWIIERRSLKSDEIASLPRFAFQEPVVRGVGRTFLYLALIAAGVGLLAGWRMRRPQGAMK